MNVDQSRFRRLLLDVRDATKNVPQVTSWRVLWTVVSVYVEGLRREREEARKAGA